MRVLVLGPLTVIGSDGAERVVSARRHRDLLTLLVLADDRPVPADVLAEDLWRGRPPRTWATTLQGYVARLRRILGDDAAALVAERGGYRLRRAAVELDGALAAQEIGAGRRHLADGDPAAAVPLLSTALARWRGDPLPEVADLDVGRPVVARLEELRLEGETALAEARLALGREAEALPRLRALVTAHPTREGLAALLATALYRAGRASEALTSLRTLRATLREELAVEPSPALARLERDVLRHDPGLAGPAPGPGARPARLHGRDAELAAMRRAVARAGDEGPVAVVLVGEPGIGKTALLDELVRATGPPVVVRRATGRGPDGGPPFGLWRELFGPPSGTTRPAVAAETSDAIRALAGSGPVLLVLDDLHAADADSLAVLEVVARSSAGVPVTLAVGCRGGRARREVTAVLAALARRPGPRFDLGGLGPESVAAILRDHGVATAGSVAEAVARRCGGNPFFAGELADLVAGDAGATDLPVSVRDVVAARLDVLDDRERAVVEVAAVLGRGLDGDLLDDVSGGGGPPAWARPIADGLLDPTGSPRHDLVREAVLDGLAPARRRAWHAAVADALDARGDGAPTARAWHRSEAAGGRRDPAAAAACLDAARSALDGGGDDDAAALARRGLVHAGPGPAREDLLRVAGTALSRVGRLDEAARAFGEEADGARARGDWSRLADLALAAAPVGIGGYWTGYDGLLVDARPWLTEAASHTDALDPARRCGLWAAEAVGRAARGEPGAAALAADAEAVAASLDGPSARGARARAGIAAFLAGWGPHSIAERLTSARDLLAGALGDPDLEPSALHLVRVAELEAGHLAGSNRFSARFGELARTRRDPDLALAHAEWESMIDLLRGDHDAAEARIATMSAGLGRLAPAAATRLRISAATVAGIRAWDEGRLVDMARDAAAIAADADDDYRLVVALGLAQAGRTAAALEPAEGWLDALGTGEGPRTTIRAVMLAEILVEAARHGADARHPLARLEGTLETWQEGTVVLWPGVVCLGPTLLYRGSVRAALGRDGAVDDLRRARALADRLGARPYRDRAERRLAASAP